MARNFNKNSKKQLLISFLIGFIIFFIGNKFAHSDDLPEEKQSLTEELFYALWMGVVITLALNWGNMKAVFSKKKQNEA